MSRNHENLRVFGLADGLVIAVYRYTSEFPAGERDGLRCQLRRAAVSIPANIVEGCARRSRADYARFLDIALSSANELHYLVDLAHRLGFIDRDAFHECRNSSHAVIRCLQKLLDAVSRMPS